MTTINTNNSIRFKKLENTGCEDFHEQNKKVFSQKNDRSLQQTNLSTSEAIRQYQDTTDVRLDYEIDDENRVVTITVINNASGKIVREIPIKPEIQMYMLKGFRVETVI